MSAHVPALPLELDPLIAEAKQRARRRRLIAAAVLLAVGSCSRRSTRAWRWRTLGRGPVASDQAATRAGEPAARCRLQGLTARGDARASRSDGEPRRHNRDPQPELEPVLTRRQAEALLRRGDVEMAAHARSGRVLPSGSTCAAPEHAPCARAGRLGVHRSLLVELVRARVEPQRQLRSTSGGVSPDRAGRRDGTSRAESDRRREAAARRAAVRRPGAFHPERDPVHAGHSPGDAEVRAPPASADRLGRDDPVQGEQPGFIAHPGAWLSYTVVLTNRSRRPSPSAGAARSIRSNGVSPPRRPSS